MTPEEITKKIVEAVEEDGTFTCESYGGRGMFRKMCLVIRLGCMETDMIKVGALLQKALVDNEGDPVTDIYELADKARTDTMGHGVILYFPNLPSPEGN